MTREKTRRGDQELDQRGRGMAENQGEQVAPLSDRASQVWRRISDAMRPDAAGEIDTTARAGLADPAHELPFRGELEQQVGRDLSKVRAHSGPNAAAAATQLGAEAYSVDGEVVFGTSQPSKELVAHELVHALQAQQGGAAGRATDEAEAEHAGGQLAAGSHLDPAQLGGSATGVRKQAKSPTQALTDLVQALGSAELEQDDEQLGSQEDKDGDTTTFSSSPGRATLSSTRTTVTVEVAEAQRVEVKEAIVRAKLAMTVEMMFDAGKAIGLRSRASGLDEEAATLLLLDPVLVAGKAEQMQREAANKRATANAIDEENDQRRQFLESLDRGIEGIDVGDALDIANDLQVREIKLRRSQKVTTKQALGIDVVKGKISRERGVEETETDEAGSTKTGKRSKSTFSSSGGLGGEHSQTRSTEAKDTEGNVLRGEELTATAHGKAVVKDDGTVGVDGGAKLVKAIDHGNFKSTSSVAFGGGVTVNIVALPRPTPEAVQQYSVVVTMNLAAAGAFGLSKSREREHATGSMGVTAGVSVSGEITHTHILDADAAASYLETLEQAGNGDPAAASKASEFGMLFKAIHGASNVDALAGSVTSTVGDAKAAASLGVDESVELTMKIGGSLDVSFSATSASEKTSAGVDLGGETEAFRTLKVARVAGEPGQQLVGVTVMFGDKQEQHGALTGAALGVSASVGQKQWTSAEQAVTFELDAQLPDYPDLYQTIVHATSREQLAALRKSPRFRGHVDAYSDKSERGGSESLGIEGALGVATKDSWARSSSQGMKDGERVIEEIGSSKSEIGFSVGPLELLRREQTAKASFESRGGVSTLDLSEQTTDSTATTLELPSWQQFLAAESPAKALEAAVRENRSLLRGFLLDPDDLLTLTKRAREREHKPWATVPETIGRDRFNDETNAWLSLGRRLDDPVVDPAFSVDDIVLGREVARGTAVADFMAEVGRGKGLQYLDVPLREWHKVSGFNADDVGVAYEFPDGIKGEDYVELRYELRSVDRELGAMAVGEDGVHPGIEHCIDLEARTAQQIGKLEAAWFESERPRVEMIDELRRLVTPVGARRRALEHPTAATENTIADVADAVHHREEALRVSKRSERMQLARCESRIGQDHGMFSTPLADELEPYVGSGGQIEQLYENHVRLLHRLRATYRAAQVPESAWICSTGPHGESRETDIDLDRALNALWAYLDDRPFGIATIDYDKISTRWHGDYWDV